jgi:hypothetical protein
MIPVLGTAQFGSSYGITNFGKVFRVEEVNDLLDLAMQSDVVWLDSSINYGNSESIINNFTKFRFNISTKVNFRDIRSMKLYSVENEIRIRLGNHRVINCFIHDWNELNIDEKKSAFDFVKESPLIKWGPSVYDPKDALEIIESFPDFDSIQLPSSILDQRFVKYFDALRSKNIEIWQRSILLQGLISDNVQKTFYVNHPDIVRLRSFCAQGNFNPIHLALSFAKLTNPNYAIFGVSNDDQLCEILSYCEQPIEFLDFNQFASNDGNLIDPRKWKN